MYKEYYENIEKWGLKPLMDIMLEKFDFQAYYEFRNELGYGNISKKNDTKDFLYELLCSSYSSNGSKGTYVYSGHLCCSLTDDKIDISYGEDSTHNGPLDYRFIVTKKDLRKEKIKRLI